MSKLIIGVDPDSYKNGVALYNKSGELTRLKSLSTLKFCFFIDDLLLHEEIEDIQIHIEDLKAISASSFKHTPKMKQSVKNTISESVGKCKQAQTEIENIAAHFGIEVVKHRVSSKWKTGYDKTEFNRLTGWLKSGNEDTRSAAYFGYIGVLKNKGNNNAKPNT